MNKTKQTKLVNEDETLESDILITVIRVICTMLDVIKNW